MSVESLPHAERQARALAAAPGDLDPLEVCVHLLDGLAAARRLGMVEPVFGQIKANRRIDRFKRRGRAAARSEWRLIAATHNLLKLHRLSLAAAAA